MSLWIDTHCHLDAAEFHADTPAVRARARQAGVERLVIPGVAVSNFQAVRELAHLGGDAYALGIHPLYVAQSGDADLATLAAELKLRLDDPRLVAVGEIGLDFFVPELQLSPLREKQEFFYREQLLLIPESMGRTGDLRVSSHQSNNLLRPEHGLPQRQRARVGWVTALWGEHAGSVNLLRDRVFCLSV
jgi:Tat protein secretion system quality control protein TatD with DNase activity